MTWIISSAAKIITVKDRGNKDGNIHKQQRTITHGQSESSGHHKKMKKRKQNKRYQEWQSDGQGKLQSSLATKMNI